MQGVSMRKEKLTIDEQIKHMKNKSNIKFNIVKEDDAKDFLLNNTYYFKLKAYSKNFEKYQTGPNKGKYLDLEFAYLKELSTLDLYFRRMILKISLDIEHFLKTQMLRELQDNFEEDGYGIIKDFFAKYDYVEENINMKGKNSITADLVNKYSGNFAIWNIVEILSFNDFSKLYQLYYEKYPSENSASKYLWSVRMLRNAAAHNNCLLNSLKIPYKYNITPNQKIMNFLSRISTISRTTRGTSMKNPVVHDFVVMLYVFNNIVTSDGVKFEIMKELKSLFDDRMLKNKTYFSKNETIKSYYMFMKNIIDYFYDLSV